MSNPVITKANLMGDQHVYYITVESSFWGDKKLIVYDMDGDGIITDGDGNTAQGDIIDSIGVNSEELDTFKAQAQELITQFQQELPNEVSKFRECWDGSFYNNAFNDCVIDENNDEMPDRLGFTTSSGADVSISYARKDLPEKCDLKDEYKGVFKNPEDELLSFATKDGSKDKLFNCEPRKPRGVAQYFATFNTEPEGPVVACGIVQLHPREQMELALAEFGTSVYESAAGVASDIGDGVSSAASATASFFSSAGDFISDLLPDSDDGNDDGYAYNERQSPFIVGFSKF